MATEESLYISFFEPVFFYRRATSSATLSKWPRRPPLSLRLLQAVVVVVAAVRGCFFGKKLRCVEHAVEIIITKHYKLSQRIGLTIDPMYMACGCMESLWLHRQVELMFVACGRL